MNAPLVRAGDQFEQLTAISAQRRPYGARGHNRWVWTCACVCGRSVEIVVGNLTSGNSKSCGCMMPARVKAARTSHGCSNERTTGRGALTEYNSWMAMKGRCFNVRHPRFKDYGARGITICDRWRDSFENFLADMGRKPSPKHTIEREDNDGIYGARTHQIEVA